MIFSAYLYTNEPSTWFDLSKHKTISCHYLLSTITSACTVHVHAHCSTCVASPHLGNYSMKRYRIVLACLLILWLADKDFVFLPHLRVQGLSRDPANYLSSKGSALLQDLHGVFLLRIWNSLKAILRVKLSKCPSNI